MCLWQAMRSSAPLLLGLFMIAQVVGVAPLLSLHAADAFEEPSTGSDRNYAGAFATHHHADHQHQGGDVRDECCAVHHHLAGVLPHAFDAVDVVFVIARTAVPPLAPVETAYPTLPERPPKLLRFI
jgi:hypothetical protein